MSDPVCLTRECYFKAVIVWFPKRHVGNDSARLEWAKRPPARWRDVTDFRRTGDLPFNVAALDHQHLRLVLVPGADPLTGEWVAKTKRVG